MHIYTQSRAEYLPRGGSGVVVGRGLWWEWGWGWEGVSGGDCIRNKVVPYKRSSLLRLQRQLFGTGTGSLGLSERISVSLFYASLPRHTRDLPAN